MKYRYYSNEEKIETIGMFLSCGYGYYNFLLENGEEIIFEEIRKSILEEYDLNIESFRGNKFHITYSVLTDDLDDDDFVTLRLDNLKLVHP